MPDWQSFYSGKKTRSEILSIDYERRVKVNWKPVLAFHEVSFFPFNTIEVSWSYVLDNEVRHLDPILWLKPQVLRPNSLRFIPSSFSAVSTERQFLDQFSLIMNTFVSPSNSYTSISFTLKSFSLYFRGQESIYQDMMLFLPLRLQIFCGWRSLWC